jgi:FdhD protein
LRPKPSAGVTQRIAIKSAAARPEDDDVAVEEPLEIRVAGDALSVTMRTPGADRELALGFLFAEGIIRSIEDVGSVAHCGRPGEEGFGNVIEVLPGPGVALSPERAAWTRRGTLVSSACGVCGRATIADLVARCAPIADPSRIEAKQLARMCSSLRSEQPIFARTGGVHAAAIFDLPGRLRAVHEDIGRHNAVDKVVGTLLLARALPAAGTVLVVSGRASFEIVQKAVAAGIPMVASVSAPSSLAIDLADQMNVTLACFVREATLTVYAHPERVVF